jgi:hypothetical protein
MGMFDSIIKRIEKYEEGVRFSKSAATVDKSKSWNQLKAMDISQMKVLEERLKNKKDFEHFGNFYSHRRCWFDTCRRIFDDCRRIKDSANDKLAANMAMATDM